MVGIKHFLFLFIIGLNFVPEITFSVPEIENSSSKIQKKLTEDQIKNIDQLLETLTVEQKVGQLLIYGYSGTLNSAKKVITSYQPGGLITFRRNIKSLHQISDWNREIQKAGFHLNDLPVLSMIDQEGGSVIRVNSTPPMPSALALGTVNDLNLTKNIGKATGEFLAVLGFNMNLAPVLDVSDPLKKNFIGNRSYGNNPEQVWLHAQAFSQGLFSAGIIPTAKHYPGHGGVTSDSHKIALIKLYSQKELENHDLVPFINFFKVPLQTAVMVGHIVLPKIDRTNVPAGFSNVLLVELLRKKYQYDGLVITDDLEMLGAAGVGEIGQRAVKAIQAGCDMIMVAWSGTKQKKVFTSLLNAVKNQEISIERLNQSVFRILSAKYKIINNKSLKNKVPSKKIESEFKKLAAIYHEFHRQNFIKAQNESLQEMNKIKFNLLSQKYIVFSAETDFFRNFKKASPQELVNFIQINKNNLNIVRTTLLEKPEYSGVFYVTGSITANFLNTLPSSLKQRIIVVNGFYPGSIGGQSTYRAVLNLNSLNSRSGFWLSQIIFSSKKIAQKSFSENYQ
ncbi:MAG: beta-N-acetylhexosaminidase [Bdellovibrionales bacterium]|nr:beta-N-acetylhexosaminidase [Bdellovibrionales bacterium]